MTGREGMGDRRLTSGGRLAGIDVADNDDVDVSLVLLTAGPASQRWIQSSQGRAMKTVTYPIVTVESL